MRLFAAAKFQTSTSSVFDSPTSRHGSNREVLQPTLCTAYTTGFDRKAARLLGRHNGQPALAVRSEGEAGADVLPSKVGEVF